MSRWTTSLWRLPVASGLLLALAYSTPPLLVPNLVCFVPLLYWIDAHRHDSWRRRLAGGLLFGLSCYLVALRWMHSMLDFSWLAAVLYLGLTVGFSLIAMLGVALIGWLRARTRLSLALLLPAVWLSLEWSRTWGDTRMTADHLAHSLAKFPFLVQFADIVGPYGVGAFLLVVNALLYEALALRGSVPAKRRLAFLVALVLAALLYDGWRWLDPPEGGGTIRVAYVQPNIPLQMKWDPGRDADVERILADLTRQAAKEGPEIIIWPESARPRTITHNLLVPETYSMPEVGALARETGSEILTGVEYGRYIGNRTEGYFNAALLVRRDGSLAPVWTAKTYLVPFVEGIPFEPILGRFLAGRQGEMRWMAGGFTAGPRATPLPADKTLVGVLVCYEELYPDLARALRAAGAGLQVIITNDAWFGRTYFQRYQADTVRLRAIENRSAFVRVANTGISGFVDPLGRFHDRSDLFVPAFAVRDLPIAGAPTVYARVGDLVAWFALAVSILAVGVAVARRGRQVGSESAQERPGGPAALSS